MALTNGKEKVRVKITVEDREIDGIIDIPCSSSWAGCAVVLTHGARGDMYFHHLQRISSHLAQSGILCLRFTCQTPNFKYRIRCFEAALHFLREQKDFDIEKCIIAGRSMGARVAAELATVSDLTNQFIFGVACLSYPLHPPRKFSELRVSPLIQLGIPVLFISGTKDQLCRKDLMENVLDKMSIDWKMHWVEKADHSLNINSKPNTEVIEMMCEWVVTWCQSVFMAER